MACGEVASKATFFLIATCPAEQRLAIFERDLIDREDIVHAVHHEIFDDHIKPLAMGERVSGARQQIIGLIKREF